MRNALCTLLMLTATVATAAPFVTNLLPDPGFEAKEWTLGSWEVCEYKGEYVPEAHSGQVAAKLSALKPGKDNRISAIATSKPVPVDGGKPYLLALWYRTEPQVTAAVSVITFSAPFATAQWKTPQSSYNTYQLPPSESWRLWTLRFDAPTAAVEATVLPRVTMVGTVWFDDLSLAPAGQAEITPEYGSGEIRALPALRGYHGALRTPAGHSCQMRVYSRADGKLVKSLPCGPNYGFTATLPAGQALDAVIVEPASGSILAATELPAPPLVAFALTSPRYRRTIFQGDKTDSIRWTMAVHATADIVKKTSLQVALKSPDGKQHKLASLSLGELSRQLTNAMSPTIETSRRLPLPLQVGTYVVLAEITAPDGPHRFEESFCVVAPPPAGTHEFTANADNVLLMDGKPFVARGFMGGAASVYGPAVQAGFNVGHSFGGPVEEQIRWLDGLGKLGMFGIVGTPADYVTKQDLEGLREAVRKLRGHPALLGYYFPDEPSPDKPGMKPEDWKPFYEMMVQEDPYHPVMTTMYDPEYADDYASVLDILLFDPYPIRSKRQPLTVVSDFITRARELTHNRKPIWAVPQAFGWDIVEGLKGDPTWTTPTPQQARCMSYLALASGAQGLVYYCYHVYTQYDQAKQDAGGWPWVLGGYLPEKQPALWGALAKVGQEMKLLEPALGRPARMWQESGMFLREISPAAGQMGYLIAVNPSETRAADAVIKLQSRLPRLHELEEIERRTCCVTVHGNEVHLKLGPMEVGIWKLPGE